MRSGFRAVVFFGYGSLLLLASVYASHSNTQGDLLAFLSRRRSVQNDALADEIRYKSYTSLVEAESYKDFPYGKESHLSHISQRFGEDEL